MAKIRNRYLQILFLFLTGGFAYVGIEDISRGHSHISMFIAGGICFLLIGLINEVLPWDLSLITQMFLSSIIITGVELFTGLVVNRVLHLNVWDYSNLPLNFLGQISLVFSVIWFFLSFLGILADDWIRHWFFGQEKPKYHLL